MCVLVGKPSGGSPIFPSLIFRQTSWIGRAVSVLFFGAGGELDKKDRAPTNLVASGAFRRASEALAERAEEVLKKVELLSGAPQQEFLKEWLDFNASGVFRIILHIQSTSG